MADLITNGSMEADSNWNNDGTPTTNERSSTQKQTGAYSRKFIVNANLEGIKSDTFSLANGSSYNLRLWVYPDDTTTVHVGLYNGSGDDLAEDITGLTKDAWNLIKRQVACTNTSANCFIFIQSPTGQATGTWYVDDASLHLEVAINALMWHWHYEMFGR